MAGSGRIIEGRTAAVPGANFGLQLASALMQVAVDPFDEVDGLREIAGTLRELRRRCASARQKRSWRRRKGKGVWAGYRPAGLKPRKLLRFCRRVRRERPFGLSAPIRLGPGGGDCKACGGQIASHWCGAKARRTQPLSGPARDRGSLRLWSLRVLALTWRRIARDCHILSKRG
jgi:hypothetical protein